jgi:hypothetical protein
MYMYEEWKCISFQQYDEVSTKRKINCGRPRMRWNIGEARI